MKLVRRSLMPQSLAGAILASTLALACSSTVPPPSGLSTSPDLTAGPTSPIRTPSPQYPSPIPTLDPGAALAIAGYGKFDCNSPGGCGVALLLQPYEQGPLPVSLDYEAPMQFVIDRPTFEHATLLGPISGAPTHLQVGRWRIGLGHSYSSDWGACDTPCASIYFQSGTIKLCEKDFEVGVETATVTIRAHVTPHCAIDVELSTDTID